MAAPLDCDGLCTVSGYLSPWEAGKLGRVHRQWSSHKRNVETWQRRVLQQVVEDLHETGGSCALMSARWLRSLSTMCSFLDPLMMIGWVHEELKKARALQREVLTPHQKTARDMLNQWTVDWIRKQDTLSKVEGVVPTP
jgi:hypothetical protein